MNAYRNGKVHIMDRRCDTCIFRPGNLMNLDHGRRDDMVKQATTNETAIICHSTLSGDNAVCRGFFEEHSTEPLRLALITGAIEYVSADGKHP